MYQDQETNSRPMQMRFKLFRGVIKSWVKMCEEAAEFATLLGPARVVTISHSSDHAEGVITVWYWD